MSLYHVMKALKDDNELYVAVSTDPDDMMKLFASDPAVTVIPYGRRIGAVTYYSGGDPAFSPRFLYRAWLILRQKRYFDRLVKQIAPDVVVVNSMTTSWISKLPQVKKRRSICFVRETFRGSTKHFVNRYIRACLERFSKVVFLSEYDKKAASLQRASTQVIHNYCSDDRFSLSLTKEQACEMLGADPGAFQLLFVGGVSSVKGFDIAVQAVLGSDQNIRLIVAGNDFAAASQTKDKKESAYVRKWEAYVRENDRQGRIVFVGRQSDMSACYACADAVIFPMREPHQARPIFEAGFFRKPIIITDFDNIREFVENGYNGLSADNENVGDFRDKIEKLFSDEEYRNKLGMNNYKRAVKNHSQKAVSKKLNAMLKEVIES